MLNLLRIWCLWGQKEQDAGWCNMFITSQTVGLYSYECLICIIIFITLCKRFSKIISSLFYVTFDKLMCLYIFSCIEWVCWPVFYPYFPDNFCLMGNIKFQNRKIFSHSWWLFHSSVFWLSLHPTPKPESLVTKFFWEIFLYIINAQNLKYNKYDIGLYSPKRTKYSLPPFQE